MPAQPHDNQHHNAAAVAPRAGLSGLDRDIARTRILMSFLALLAIYVDPTTGGFLKFERYALATLLCHLGYSLGIYLSVKRRSLGAQLPFITTALDLLFATIIAFLTEGRTSPAYVFFVFAITAVGQRTSPSQTIIVTIISSVLYLLVIVSAGGADTVHVTRAIYLAVIGYLIGLLVKDKAVFEQHLRELESKADRRSIARSLHDDYVQVLAGMNLRLETCRELLHRGQRDDAITELTELQIGVTREYHELRAYVRWLAGDEPGTVRELPLPVASPRVQVQASFNADGLICEQILQIMLEGLRNSRQHGQAKNVRMRASDHASVVSITISDDGTGFQQADPPPWTIASRVAEFGGRLNPVIIGKAQLEVEMPSTPGAPI